MKAPPLTRHNNPMDLNMKKQPYYLLSIVSIMPTAV